jgi:hypothetical protein
VNTHLNEVRNSAMGRGRFEEEETSNAKALRKKVFYSYF